MTEDDTFRVLKRTPFKEMNFIFLEWLDGSMSPEVDIREILQNHGWGWEEFRHTQEETGKLRVRR